MSVNKETLLNGNKYSGVLNGIVSTYPFVAFDLTAKQLEEFPRFIVVGRGSAAINDH